MQDLDPAPLYGDRNVLLDAVLIFTGFDFTGATMRMQLRLAPDAPGAPLIDLSSAVYPAQGLRIEYAGNDTVANHIAAGRLDSSQVPSGLATTDTLDLSLVGIRITKANMAFVSVPADEDGDVVELSYDLLITPLGGDEDKYAYGPFYLRGTVTQ